MTEPSSIDERAVRGLLQQVLAVREQADQSAAFEFEAAFLDAGAEPALAEVLCDFLPSACGRVLVRELGVFTVDTFERLGADGHTSGPVRFADDARWRVVERFVDDLWRGTPHSRQLVILTAKQSGEFAAINNAANAGQTLDQLRGGTVATVFMTRLKHSGKP